MTVAAVESAKFLERKGEAYLLKYKLPAKKKAKAAPPTGPTKAKAVAPPRPQPIGPETAKSLHAFVVKIATYMRDAPPNLASAPRLFLLPEERRELAECASEAIGWLTRIYEAAS